VKAHASDNNTKLNSVRPWMDYMIENDQCVLLSF